MRVSKTQRRGISTVSPLEPDNSTTRAQSSSLRKSPRESLVRCLLVDAGLGEPLLNLDVRDDTGRFLGCVDMAYPEQKVAIEYHGMLHGATWAADVERIAALRAAGWVVIEVTAPLLRTPETLIRRVATALRRPR